MAFDNMADKVRAARALREHLLSDRRRPGYHFAIPEDIGRPGRCQRSVLRRRALPPDVPVRPPRRGRLEGQGLCLGAHLLLHYDTDARQLCFDATDSGTQGRPVLERAPLELAPDEPLQLRVFIDKSVVEVFANDRQAITRRVYPHSDASDGAALFARGGSAACSAIRAWDMMPSNAW